MKVTAKVKMIVIVESQSRWGGDCTLDQIEKQARDDAINTATRALKNDPLVKSILPGEVYISMECQAKG